MKQSVVALVLAEVDLDGAVVGSLADDKADTLHLQHRRGAVGDVLVQVERPGNVVNIDFCWSGHSGVEVGLFGGLRN